ncbi:MAG: hypothetical protein PVH98_11115 [Gammaproteobacteria bacterium]|jgi:hypothetical protein
MKRIVISAAFSTTFTGPARADIDTFDTGNRELFLSVRDNVNQTSLVYDFNINMDDFLPGSSFASTTLTHINANVQNYIQNSSGDISWAVMAGDNTPPNEVDGIRYLTTTNQSISMNNGELQAFTIVNTDYLANINRHLDSNTNTAIFSSVDSGYFVPTMDSWQGNAPFSATADLNESQNFYLLRNSVSLVFPPGRAQPVNQEQYPEVGYGSWALSSDGVLYFGLIDPIYVPPPEPIPLPLAIWLLGSALLGLAGVIHHKPRAELTNA